MKNAFKLFGAMLVAGALFCSCKPDDPNTDPNVPDTPVTYTVTVNSNDATLGTAAITPLQATYNENDQVTITATPAEGAKFVNWTCNNAVITENPYTFNVKENAVYTANFEALPQPSVSATLGSTPISFGYIGTSTNTQMWVFQAADHAEGNSLYLPCVLAILEGTTQANMQATSIELFNETFYEVGDDQYGDWQMESINNFNATALDLTTYTMSATMSATMWYVTDMMENGIQEIADCTHETLALTFNNITFEPVKGLRKMNVRK